MTSASDPRLALARDLGRRAGDLLSRRLRERRDNTPEGRLVEFKGRRELVTAVDRESETLLVEEIRAAFPDDAIFAEEGVASPQGAADREAEFVWVLDPLDGTTNWVHGHPSFAVSIGITRGGQPWRGVVAAPHLGFEEGGECYWGGPGVGAWCNERPLHVSNTDDLRDSVVATGFSYNRNEPGVDTNLEKFGRALMEVRGIRRCGSAALDLAHVAAGVYDAYWERYLAPYDVAAGAALVLGAGGRVRTLDAERQLIWDDGIVACNGRVGDALVGLFS